MELVTITGLDGTYTKQNLMWSHPQTDNVRTCNNQIFKLNKIVCVRVSVQSKRIRVKHLFISLFSHFSSNWGYLGYWLDLLFVKVKSKPWWKFIFQIFSTRHGLEQYHNSTTLWSLCYFKTRQKPQQRNLRKLVTVSKHPKWTRMGFLKLNALLDG